MINANSIYIREDKNSELSNFLSDHKILNKWGLLNFKNRKNLQGNFTRLSNYILDCLNLAKITFSEYKFFMWVYRKTVGSSKIETDLQFYNEISNECGISKRNLIRVIGSCSNKNLIEIGQRTVKKYGKEIKIKTVICNMFPDTWVDVDRNVKEYIENWVKNKKQDIGYVKRIIKKSPNKRVSSRHPLVPGSHQYGVR